MKLSVPKEASEGERRVACVPEVAKKLSAGGIDVVLEQGAGESAHLPDASFEEAGASLGDGYSGDVVAKVVPPTPGEIGRMKEGTVLVGFLQPLTAPEGHAGAELPREHRQAGVGGSSRRLPQAVRLRQVAD